MSSSPKVTLVGDVCIDHNIVNGRKYINWGSSLMYMGRYLTKHTCADVKLIAARGNDFNKYVDGVSIVNNPEPIKTLIYKNIVKDDHRTQFCHNTASSRPVSIDSALEQVLKHTNIFIFAPLTPNYQPDYLLALLKHVPSDSLKALTPQGYLRHIGSNGLVTKSDFINEQRIVQLFDIIIISDEDCDSPFEAALRWLSYDDKLNIVVTQNKKGATLVNKDGLRHVDTMPVPSSKIIDSVGSGDVFSAEMIAKYYASKNILQAIKAANHAAREKLLTLTDVSSTVT